MEQINLTAIIKSLPEKAEEMKALLLELVTHSTSEDACLQYDLHQDVKEPNAFIFHEIWRDANGFNEHNSKPYIRQFQTESAGILLEPVTIYITNKIG
jgi:quinol monooxygenase YgiN